VLQAVGFGIQGRSSDDAVFGTIWELVHHYTEAPHPPVNIQLQVADDDVCVFGSLVSVWFMGW
jgi:hypothetical protein